MSKPKSKIKQYADLKKLRSQLVEERDKIISATQIDDIDALQNADLLNDAAAIASQTHNSIMQINRTIAMIDAGTYGICTECQKPIPLERLKIMPDCTKCVLCSR